MSEPQADDGGISQYQADEPADLVGSAMAMREAAHTGLVVLGRAVSAVQDGVPSGRRAALEDTLDDAARRPGPEYTRLLRWMAAVLVATAELAGSKLDRSPGDLVERLSALRAVSLGADRRHAGLDRAMGCVIQALGADAPGARRALEGLAASLNRAARRAALAWSAEVTVGLLMLVDLAGGRDEVDLLTRLAEDELLDVPGLLAECGLAVGTPPPEPAAGDGRRGLVAVTGAPAGLGEAVRTAAAERRAIGVITAVHAGDQLAIDATVSGLSRREVGEVCTTLAGCVAGAAELADAEVAELVDGVAPAAAGLIARQAAAVSHGAPDMDDRLGRWLEFAQPTEVRALVAAFARAAWTALVLAAAGQGTDPETYLQWLAADVAAEVAGRDLADTAACPCASGLCYGRCCGR